MERLDDAAEQSVRPREPIFHSGERLFRATERVIRSTEQLIRSRAATDRAVGAALAPRVDGIAATAATCGDLSDIKVGCGLPHQG